MASSSCFNLVYYCWKYYNIFAPFYALILANVTKINQVTVTNCLNTTELIYITAY